MPAASLACGLRSVPVNRRAGRRNGTRRAVLLSETVPFNQATGGTVTEFTDAAGKRIRLHVMNANTTYTQLLGRRDCRVLVQGGGGGGGGGGGNQHGGGGDGGYGSDTSAVRIGEQAHSVTVGEGGGGWGGTGGASSAFGITANGGPGGAYQGGGDTHGSTRGPNSNITGTTFQYGRFGGGVHYNWGYAAGPANTGQGGGGGANTQVFGPGPGGSGMVAVSYEIAA